LNNNNKIIISGATGMLGQALLREIEKKSIYKVYCYSRFKENIFGNFQFLTSSELQNHEFYAFFHCAAEVNVDLCEKDFNHAVRSNHDYVKLLFENIKAKYNFYISTDSVYEGTNGYYKEIDYPKPINNYSLSKLMGEDIAKIITPNLYIIRTNIFGLNSKNKSSLFEWAIRELSNGNLIQGFEDIFFNPISVNHLSLILLLMLKEEVDFGIYNIGSDFGISKYEFLIKTAKLISANPDLVKPSKFLRKFEMANRPKNTIMNCDKIKQKLVNLDLSLQTSFDLLMF
jgi:dTDP-4-dehydrorhamnose reductase